MKNYCSYRIYMCRYFILYGLIRMYICRCIYLYLKTHLHLIISHIQKLQLTPICKYTMLHSTPPFSLDGVQFGGHLAQIFAQRAWFVYTPERELPNDKHFKESSNNCTQPLLWRSRGRPFQGGLRTGLQTGPRRRPVTPAPSCLVLAPHWPPATAWVPMKAPHVRAAGHSIDLQSCHKLSVMNLILVWNLTQAVHRQNTLIHETHPFQTQPSPIRRGATAGRPVVANHKAIPHITIHHAGGIFLYKRNPR